MSDEALAAEAIALLGKQNKSLEEQIRLKEDLANKAVKQAAAEELGGKYVDNNLKALEMILELVQKGDMSKDIATEQLNINQKDFKSTPKQHKKSKVAIEKPKVDEQHEDAYIHKSGRTIGISEDDNILVRKDMEKVNKGGSEKQAVVNIDNKELIKTISTLQASIDKLSNSLSSGQKIMLTDTDGSYIGRGLMQKARG